MLTYLCMSALIIKLVRVHLPVDIHGVDIHVSAHIPTVMALPF